VLTLPEIPSDFDDGLLTASEIAQLKLNADWVVLSACNMAAGDKPLRHCLDSRDRFSTQERVRYWYLIGE
jgi:hypothetical protein